MARAGGQTVNSLQVQILFMIQTQIPKLNFLCFGAGAIGTYIGGSLALAGQQVVFVEQPGAAAALRENGLRLTLKDQTYFLPHPQVNESIGEALAQSTYDVSILAVKAYHTDALIKSLQPYADQLPPFVCLQNGVENEAKLTAAFGAERVIAATVTSAIGRRAAGDIVVEKMRGTGIALGHAKAPDVLRAFQAAGLKAQAFTNPEAMKWSKMLTNLLANASSAILDLPPSQIYAHPDLYHLEVRMLQETLAVMRASNLPVVDLPATPVRLLVWLVTRLPEKLSRPLLLRSLGKGRGSKMPSFHIDLASGSGLSEVDYLNGAVVRIGRQLGIDTPVNQVLTDTLTAITQSRLPRATFAGQPEKLLALLQSPHS